MRSIFFVQKIDKYSFYYIISLSIMILLLFNCNKMVVEQQKPSTEFLADEKAEKEFVDDLKISKSSSEAEKIVKENIDSGKAWIVAKNFDKVANKINDPKKLDGIINSLDVKGCLDWVANVINKVTDPNVINNIISRVNKSSDANCVKKFSEKVSSNTINKLDDKNAKEFISKIDSVWALKNIANCVKDFVNSEVVKHTFDKVNKSSDSGCVKEFANKIDANAINKIEPNNAKGFINKVVDAWCLSSMAKCINKINDKDVVQYTVNKVTEKWDAVCLKEFSKNLGVNSVNSMDSKWLDAFARKSLMKWGNECAKVMESNKALMGKIDKWTSSLIKEYAGQADATLDKQLDNI